MLVSDFIGSGIVIRVDLEQRDPRLPPGRPPSVIPTFGIIDTGAYKSVVSQHIVDSSKFSEGPSKQPVKSLSRFGQTGRTDIVDEYDDMILTFPGLGNLQPRESRTLLSYDLQGFPLPDGQFCPHTKTKHIGVIIGRDIINDWVMTWNKVGSEAELADRLNP